MGANRNKLSCLPDDAIIQPLQTDGKQPARQPRLGHLSKRLSLDSATRLTYAGAMNTTHFTNQQSDRHSLQGKVALRRELTRLRAENAKLTSALVTATDHSRRLETAQQAEKGDLATMRKMALQQADAMTEAALRKTEQQLRLIVEAIPVPVAISRVADGRLVYANAILGELMGAPAHELVGCETRRFYENPADCARLLSLLHTQGQVERQEVQLRRVDGAPVWVEISLRWLEFHEEPAILAVLHDITHLKQMNQAASRFVPQEYLGFLHKKSITDIQLGDHISGEMTVMFCDMRDFTTISETMTPQENFAFINGYLGRVSPLVRQHQGFIIKYFGDGIHAIFPRCADDALQAALAQLQAVNAYNEQRRRKNRQPLQVGIGLNTGHLLVGMVGEEHRMQGDAFSDTVNITYRLEGLTKVYNTPLIISAATYAHLADPSRYQIRFLDKVQVMGKQQALDLYEVYDADPPALRQRKAATHALYSEALALFYDRQFAAAQSQLFAVLQHNPQDQVAWRHLVKATQLLDSGVPADWTGVTVMGAK